MTLFNLAVWSEEPPEIHFSKNVGILDSTNRRRKCVFPEMSKIHFPGLGTFRLATWTTYVFHILAPFGL